MSKYCGKIYADTHMNSTRNLLVELVGYLTINIKMKKYKCYHHSLQTLLLTYKFASNNIDQCFVIKLAICVFQ